ncbi:MAG: YqgE/AlgH family protein [Pseudomonadales bacterium]|nr:YqgE/AlgH family protein [Pseudomonadales bacterium]
MPVSLKNQLLIAMPNLVSPEFANSVVYLCEHNEDGAMGIIINRAADISFGEILEELNIEGETTEQPVFLGGPVEPERGFILHSMDNKRRQRWEYTLPITDKLALTLSHDILFDIAHNQGPKKSLFALGYAGWGAGQLEQEMAENAWLSVSASSRLIFDTPDAEVAHKALLPLGVNLDLISRQAGHA